MKIDIRELEVEDKITEIVFGDGEEGSYNICAIENNEGIVRLKDADKEGDHYIDCEGDARNLIKALEKALELGWWD